MLRGRATSDAPPLAITRKQYQVSESSAVEFLNGAKDLFGSTNWVGVQLAY
jgi:hypothetical protein